MDSSQPRTFDFLRAATIALLGAAAYAYFRILGVPVAKTLPLVLGGCAFLAILWVVEWITSGEAPAVPKAKKDGFDWGMHYLRGFAIVCIMLTHFLGRTGAAKFAHAFLTSSTVFFLFISGYLCQYLAFRRPVESRKYYLSKLKNVIALYVVCSLATLAAILAINAKRVGVIAPSDLSLRAMPDILLLGWVQRQYWYIPFVAVLFLVSPWLTRSSNRTLAWLSVVSFVLAVSFPHRPPSHLVWSIPHFLYRMVYFTWAYLLGFAYARWKRQIDPHLGAYVAPTLLTGMALGVCALAPETAFWRPEYVLADSFAWSFQKLLFLVPVLYVANRIRSTRIALFDMLATYSFTLFFLHHFFIRDYAVLQKLVFLHIGPAPVLRLCVRVVLAAIFIGQNLVLSILLKKACGRWSRSFIGS